MEDVERVARALGDVGETTAAELARDLRLTLPTAAGASAFSSGRGERVSRTTAVPP